MLLNKNIDTIALATAKECDNIYALNKIKITETEMIASNGHSLYWTSTQNCDTLADYPAEDLKQITNYPIFVSDTAIKKAIRNRPAKSMQVLQNICLQTTENEIELITRDLKTTDTVKEKNEEICYPNIETLKNCLNGEELITVGLGVAQLEILLKMAKKQGSSVIALSVCKNENQPIPVKFGEITGMIMPHRLD